MTSYFVYNDSGTMWMHKKIIAVVIQRYILRKLHLRTLCLIDQHCVRPQTVYKRTAQTYHELSRELNLQYKLHRLQFLWRLDIVPLHCAKIPHRVIAYKSRFMVYAFVVLRQAKPVFQIILSVSITLWQLRIYQYCGLP